MKIFLVCIFGLIVYVIKGGECRNADCNLKNTLSDAEQNIGETCFANISFTCNPDYKYRAINGACTNLEVPSRGMPGSAFTRLLAANYEDNKKAIKLQSDGKELNSPRVLSNVFFTDLKEDDPNNFDTEFSLSMMLFAQVLTHDVSGTGGKTGDSCCTDNGQRKTVEPDNCLGIKVPTGDRFYSQFQKTCLNLRRTRSTEDIGCPVTPILPLNFVTSFIDASLLYGSSEEANKELRLGEKGLLKFQEINNGIFPPNVDEPHKVCRVETNEELCIQAGDSRSNAHPMLAVMQALLLRLHNKIATELEKLNRDWVDDKLLFEETRRTVIAFIQQITFKDYLPNLIGKSYLEKINCGLVLDQGYHDVYDSTVNPQVLAEFSGCAFRSLHSSIVGRIYMYDNNYQPVQQWNFSDFYNSVGFISKGDNFEQLIRGMTKDPQGNIDRFFTTSITDLLFQMKGVGADLESMDIGKARDLGIKFYVDYLAMIGKPYPQSWDDYKDYMPDNMIERLKKRYDSYKDVELFIGGILEYDAPDSHIGPVFQAIIAEQFCRLQQGDRFYFEAKNQPYPFTEKQLEQIRKVTLAWLYCYTCPKLKNMQPDAFRLYSDENQPIPCTEILKEFTLEPWKVVK